MCAGGNSVAVFSLRGARSRTTFNIISNLIPAIKDEKEETMQIEGLVMMMRCMYACVRVKRVCVSVFVFMREELRVVCVCKREGACCAG